MADTVISIKGDIKDLETKIDTTKKKVEEAFNGMSSATKKYEDAQKSLNDTMAKQKSELAPITDRLKELLELKKENGTLTEKEAKELKNLQSQYSNLTKLNKLLNQEKQQEIKLLKEQDSLSKKEYQNASKLEASLQKQVFTKQKLIASLEKETAKRKENNVAVENNVSSLRKEDAERRALGTTVVRHIRRLESLAVAYYAISSAYRTTFGEGVKLNKQYQDMQLGIAAIIASKTTATDATGKETDAVTKFNMAQQMSKTTMDEIKKAALSTPATFMEMAGFYQQAIGHAMAAGDSFGSSLKEISTNTISLTKYMSLLGSSAGMDMNRINEEIRSLMSGNASSDSLLAQILFGSPAAANNAIKDAKTRTGGLTKLMKDVLEPFKVLESQDTYTKALANLNDQIDTIRKNMSQPIFEDLQTSYRTFEEYLKKNGDDITKYTISLYEDVKVSYFEIDKAIRSVFTTFDDGSLKVGQLADSFVNISTSTAGVVAALSIIKDAIANFIVVMSKAIDFGQLLGSAFTNILDPDKFNADLQLFRETQPLLDKQIKSYDEIRSFMKQREGAMNNEA